MISYGIKHRNGEKLVFIVDIDVPESVTEGERIRAAVLQGIERGLSFRGADLDGADLRGMDLSGNDFADVKFTGALLDGICLDNCNLSNSDFYRMRMSDVSFRGANLGDASFGGTVVLRCDFTRAILTNTNFDRSYLIDTCFDQAEGIMSWFRSVGSHDCSFSEAEFQKAAFAQSVFVNGTFEGTKVVGCDFGHTLFKCSTISDCDIVTSNFRHAFFIECKVDESSIDLVSMDGSHRVQYAASSEKHFGPLHRGLCRLLGVSGTPSEALLTSAYERHRLLKGRIELERQISSETPTQTEQSLEG